jgi:RNA polymerase sigma factor (sigma-70 family)
MTERAKSSYRARRMEKRKGGAGYTGPPLPRNRLARIPTAMPENLTVPPSFRTPADRAAAAYRAHYDLLRFLAQQRFRIPVDEVPGVIHDVFIAFMQSEAKIARTEADERSWLVGAVCNASRYYWRKHRGEELPADIESYIDPCAVAEDAITRLTVAGVLRRLPERCRDLLKRRYAEGYTPEEIATWQALTRGSAKNLISKCLFAARAAFERLRRSR